ncbi:hypothetical protein PPL_03672 [Heterostelium album PN500]|uniref:Uncharacterized protein n=1 Tax=Heterostelium pallidum (strain ATCC 26659 / Pp 5 / PN500) TaxID=670386 RepID=D3B6C4_HETP5|nr:hypothetical protein PPL_03672 [Heterostelium album PN500]EFA82894.1 hypothetical protein PPL_03672 [Heterostelium album PN500]|eukprot:XP_020435011.1 hypothetical protein PPL_03672 [Heterostelium album PN500]
MSNKKHQIKDPMFISINILTFRHLDDLIIGVNRKVIDEKLAAELLSLMFGPGSDKVLNLLTSRSITVPKNIHVDAESIIKGTYKVLENINQVKKKLNIPLSFLPPMDHFNKLLAQHKNNKINSSKTNSNQSNSSNKPTTQKKVSKAAQPQKKESKATNPTPTTSAPSQQAKPASTQQQQAKPAASQQPPQQQTKPAATQQQQAKPAATQQPPQQQQTKPAAQQPQQQQQAKPAATAPTPAASSTTTGSLPSETMTAEQLRTQVQNHFNGLALVFKHNLITEQVMREHLVKLFGANSQTYLEKVISIPPSKIPELPENFSAQALLAKTDVIARAADEWKKKNQK